MTTVPYRRSTVPTDTGVGILHLGLGAFHRAHQAVYTEDAIDAAGGDWAIEAVSMRNPAVSEALNAQNGRFTLIERHPNGPRLREIGVIRGAQCLATDPAPVLVRFADPNVHIVTVTVTEKGYGYVPGTRALDENHAAVAHDLSNPDTPQGMVGTIVAGLNHRRTAGQSGLTVMACDNLPSNGRVLRSLVLEFAGRRDSALATWIDQTCRFPDSMVDRITPASTQATYDLAQQVTGQADLGAVETEPFLQWVIEDDFAGPRPAWEQAGAVLVRDVAPFETMKLRMLNGAHSLIAYMGTIGGLSAVRDVMAIPELARLVRAHMGFAAETLRPLPGFDSASYADALIKRFANPSIEHLCQQIAMDGSQKLPQRIFAPARARLNQGQDISTFAFTTAVWLRHVQATSKPGSAHALNDPIAPEMTAAIRAARGDAAACITGIAALPGLASYDLFGDSHWTDAVTAALRDLMHNDLRRVVSGMEFSGQSAIQRR